MSPLLDFTQSGQYILSIRLSADGFSFSVFNPNLGDEPYYRVFKVNTLHSLAANVKQFLQETPELHHPYKRVEILYKTSRYTAVPLQWYEDDMAETLFYQNLPKQNNENVLRNILHGTNIVILFSMDKLSHLYLSEHFPQARFLVSVSPQVECLLTRARTENKRLYVNLSTTEMEVCCLQAGKLLLLNTYRAMAHEDRLYYLLQIWRDLGLSQTSDELCLVGNEKIVEELRNYFSHYIRKVGKFHLHEALQLSKPYDKQLPFEMQTLLSCE